ncbi:hypothetical protein Sjap_020016 [Stephania japonica]|uniref:Uncharacterized protein n=1 Tax=Stephania japonica TaxID=461633 RepID=A0AAP0HYN2_9MAGN
MGRQRWRMPEDAPRVRKNRILELGVLVPDSGNELHILGKGQDRSIGSALPNRQVIRDLGKVRGASDGYSGILLRVGGRLSLATTSDLR